MSIIDAVLEVHSALTRSGPTHAFGGALALAYYGEPRATVDIDVNVFALEGAGPQSLEALATIGYAPERDPNEVAPNSGLRLRRTADRFPVDLFPPLGPAYEEIGQRLRYWPFGPGRDELPFLSAEDLVVFKLSFGRDKDWVDLRQLCRSGIELDVEYVERQLIELRGPTMYPRLARLRSLLR